MICFCKSCIFISWRMVKQIKKMIKVHTAKSCKPCSAVCDTTSTPLADKSDAVLCAKKATFIINTMQSNSMMNHLNCPVRFCSCKAMCNKLKYVFIHHLLSALQWVKSFLTVWITIEVLHPESQTRIQLRQTKNG